MSAKGQRIGYARVSSVDQNADRQIHLLEKMNCDRIFTDHMSGKNVDRKALQELLRYTTISRYELITVKP